MAACRAMSSTQDCNDDIQSTTSSVTKVSMGIHQRSQ
jgi:hypothetical protein